MAALREASAIATAAGDRARQIAAVERLVAAQRDAGDHAGVLAALDTLSELAGHSAALAACPPDQLGTFLGETAPA
nr:hypothetical protein GCM10025699_34720 [Microbacterium flavescens]